MISPHSLCVYLSLMDTQDCVFVVDDDASARNGFARLLRAAGHFVRTFASANEFLEAAETETSGCLVLDVRMPGMSGEELQAELHARGVNLPIIVVTADDNPGIKRMARRIGATGLFRKPIDGAALLDAVEWALRSNLVNGNHEPD